MSYHDKTTLLITYHLLVNVVLAKLIAQKLRNENDMYLDPQKLA